MLLSVSDVHQIINFLAAFLMLLIRTKGSIYIEQRAKAIINSAIFPTFSPTLALLDSTKLELLHQAAARGASVVKLPVS